jgi:hypothetical protein
MPAGPPPGPTTAASSDLVSPQQDQYVTRSLPAAYLQDGSNILAVELHQSGPASADAVLDLTLNGLTPVSPTSFEVTEARETNADRVAALAMQWQAVPNAESYNVYMWDLDAGSESSFQLKDVIYSYAAPPVNGLIMYTASVGNARKVHADFYVTSVVGGVESPPSGVTRVWAIPNVEEKADGTGYDILYIARNGTAQAPPRVVPSSPARSIPPTAPEVLPSEGAPNGSPGAGWAAVALLVKAFYEHQVALSPTRADLRTITTPTVYTATAVTESEVDALAQKYKLRRTSPSVALSDDQYKTLARTCLGSRLRSVAGPQACETLSILFPGSNDIEATRHYATAIANNPSWIVLTRDIPSSIKQTTVSRTWYNSFAPCNRPRATGKSCDEYPFYTTAQGGRMPAALDDQVATTQNTHVGSVLNALYTACAVPNAIGTTPFNPSGGAFAVVPLPFDQAPPTTYICAV